MADIKKNEKKTTKEGSTTKNVGKATVSSSLRRVKKEKTRNISDDIKSRV